MVCCWFGFVVLCGGFFLFVWCVGVMCLLLCFLVLLVIFLVVLIIVFVLFLIVLLVVYVDC